MNNTTDQAVINMLRKVAEKKELIEKAKKRPQWKTNCVFKGIAKNINIQTVRDENVLLEILGSLILEKKAKEEAANILELEYDGQYSGYHIEEWIEDFKTRVNMLKIEKEKQEIEELDKRVNKLVTSEQRREMELKALQEILGE